jgi:hypothetical protein
MTVQTINIGNVVNDGLGDDLRTAFQKVNANFAELNSSLTVTAKNIGTGANGIFAQKIGAELQFKSLSAGTKIVLEPFSDSIRINSSQPDAFTSITAETGFVSAANNNLALAIQGGQNIVTTAGGSTVTIDTVLDLNQILLSYDFGYVIDNFDHPLQMALSAANIDFGTIDVPGQFNLDFGTI